MSDLKQIYELTENSFCPKVKLGAKANLFYPTLTDSGVIEDWVTKQ